VVSGYAGEWWGRGRRFGITTLTGDRVYWWAARNEPADGHAADEQMHVADLFRGWADPVPELIATTPAEKMLRNDIVDRPPDRRWVRGRVVLIGDAAHPTTPNFGQGGCMAIEDAAVLARHLRSGGEVAAGMAAFVAERYPRTTSVTRGSWRFGRVGHWEGRLRCWARDRLLGLVLPVLGPKGLLSYATFDVGPVPASP
jgi:2-polyprenyl-6-methoxyphenol hydroxylase-like FAD-dependent oxidoreductase